MWIFKNWKNKLTQNERDTVKLWVFAGGLALAMVVGVLTQGC